MVKAALITSASYRRRARVRDVGVPSRREHAVLAQHGLVAPFGT
jgi:hypothetical protein